jgi:DNA mismatch endonuclease, patch repair protein
VVDVVDKAKRSQIMARIGPRNTAPEMAVRRAAHRLGHRFRLHRKDLPGCPDLVLPRHRLAVFVHGCFWHRHDACTNCSMPKTRIDFWVTKFCATVARDRRNIETLHTLGWQTLIVWECETEKKGLVEDILRRALADADRKRGRRA